MFKDLFSDIQKYNRVIAIYTDSTSLQLDTRQYLKEYFKVESQFVLDVKNQRELKEARKDTVTSPFFGDYWLVHIDVEKLGVKESLKTVTSYSSNGVYVYWINDFKTYMDFRKHKIFASNSHSHNLIVANRLSAMDAYELLEYANTLVEDNKLTKDIISYVSRNYRYKVEAIYDLIALLKGGAKIESDKDVIASIGVGFLTVDSFVIDLLKANPDTLKKRINLQKKAIGQLQELSYSYSHTKIRSFMLNTLKNFLEFKQMLLLGYFDSPVIKIPQNYDENRVKRTYKRYRYTLRNDVTLSRILLLMKCVTSHNYYDTELSLLSTITQYVTSFDVINKKNKRKKKVVDTEYEARQKSKEEIESIVDDYYENVLVYRQKQEAKIKEEVARQNVLGFKDNTVKKVVNLEELDGFGQLLGIVKNQQQEMEERLKLEEKEREEQFDENTKEKYEEESYNENKTGVLTLFEDDTPQILKDLQSQSIQNTLDRTKKQEGIQNTQTTKKYGMDNPKTYDSFGREKEKVDEAMAKSKETKQVMNPFDNMFNDLELQKKQAQYMKEKKEKADKEKEKRLNGFLDMIKKDM